MTRKLITHKIRGSQADACSFYNQLGIAADVISMQHEDALQGGPGWTTTVFNVCDPQVPVVWRKLGRSPETCPVQHLPKA